MRQIATLWCAPVSGLYWPELRGRNGMGLPDEKPLEGLKAIAQHFNRSVKTAQRWEREALPVHRHPVLGVVAYRSELDVWLKERTAHGNVQGSSESAPDIPQDKPSGLTTDDEIGLARLGQP